MLNCNNCAACFNTRNENATGSAEMGKHRFLIKSNNYRVLRSAIQIKSWPTFSGGFPFVIQFRVKNHQESSRIIKNHQESTRIDKNHQESTRIDKNLDRSWDVVKRESARGHQGSLILEKSLEILVESVEESLDLSESSMNPQESLEHPKNPTRIFKNPTASPRFSKSLKNLSRIPENPTECLKTQKFPQNLSGISKNLQASIRIFRESFRNLSRIPGNHPRILKNAKNPPKNPSRISKNPKYLKNLP